MNSIKTTLRLAFLSLIILATSGAVTSYYFVDLAMRYKEEKQAVAELLLGFEKMRKDEKSFILYGRKDVQFFEEGSTPSLTAHQQHFTELKETLQELEGGLIGENIEMKPKLIGFQQYIQLYATNFTKLVDAYRVRGFKDHGLEGEMRALVHDLQDCKSAEEKVFAFSLRRHEKDFMLRKDMKYIDKLHKTAQGFSSFLAQASLPHMDEEYVKATSDNIDKYTKHFDRIVSIENMIGLTEDSGLKGDLLQSAQDLQPISDELFSAINQKSTELEAFAANILATSIAVPLLLGIILGIYFIRIVAKPIVSLNDSLTNYTTGQKVDLRANKKLSLKNEIKDLFDNFQSLLNQVENNISEINGKNEELELKAKEDDKRNWINEGLAKVSDILGGKQEDMHEMIYQLTSFIVKYTNSSTGGVFLVNEAHKQGPVLELTASFAFDIRSSLKKEVKMGEGLTGAAWYEKDTIYQTEIPANYLDITSGMGGAKPSEILIVPLISEGQIVGIIELSSLHSLSGSNREFIELAADKIASSVAFIKAHTLTKSLLLESKEMTEQLRASEEEIRQNMEELQATQEEMERTSKELASKVGGYASIIEYQEKVLDSLCNGYIVLDEDYDFVDVSETLVSKMLIGKDSNNISNCEYVLGNATIDILREFEKTWRFDNNVAEMKDVILKNPKGHVFNANLTLMKEVGESKKHIIMVRDLVRSLAVNNPSEEKHLNQA